MICFYSSLLDEEHARQLFYYPVQSSTKSGCNPWAIAAGSGNSFEEARRDTRQSDLESTHPPTFPLVLGTNNNKIVAIIRNA